MRQDNSTFDEKSALRREARELVSTPVICETHGGFGELWRACYRDVEAGTVFEADPIKAVALAYQRPTWQVIEGDCVAGLEAGVGSHLEVNLLDVDPYGDPWPVIGAFLSSERPKPSRLVVVVNDGLRRKAAISSHDAHSLKPAIPVFGAELHADYLDVCRWLLERLASPAGYTVANFGGYYCGAGQGMTHYIATLETA